MKQIAALHQHIDLQQLVAQVLLQAANAVAPVFFLQRDLVAADRCQFLAFP
jgi:hypothetical protein